MVTMVTRCYLVTMVTHCIDVTGKHRVVTKALFDRAFLCVCVCDFALEISNVDDDVAYNCWISVILYLDLEHIKAVMFLRLHLIELSSNRPLLTVPLALLNTWMLHHTNTHTHTHHN